MKLNLKVRLKNPVFIAQLLLSVITPILAYAGLTVETITSWDTLFNLLISAVSNPYVLALTIISIWNSLNDPTTKGLGDSQNALSYLNPKSELSEEKKL